MLSTDVRLTNDLRVDMDNPNEVEEVAAAMHAALGFGEHTCEISLHLCEGNVGDAADDLANGAWMCGKLINWNWDTLMPKCNQLVLETSLPEQRCLKVLQNCKGNAELAKRKLAGLRALP